MNTYYLLLICPLCFFFGCLVSLRVCRRLSFEREVLAQDNLKQARRATHFEKVAKDGQRLKRRGRKALR